MSSFIPRPPAGGCEPEVPGTPLHVTPTEAERRGRWEVRAAQWRALQLARSVFGPGVRASALGVRPYGAIRGLLHLEVPFEGLEAHRRREETFLAQAWLDPVLSRVPLVYVLGTDGT